MEVRTLAVLLLTVCVLCYSLNEVLGQRNTCRITRRGLCKDTNSRGRVIRGHGRCHGYGVRRGERRMCRTVGGRHCRCLLRPFMSPSDGTG